MDLKVGTKLIVNMEGHWTAPGGTSGVHRTRLLVEVTNIGKWNASWRTVEVLADTGAPAIGARPPAESGGFAMDALDRLVECGHYETETP